MTPKQLRALIAESGLSQAGFARSVMSRDPRTIERWLAGREIPAEAADWLASVESVRVTPTRVTVTVSR